VGVTFFLGQDRFKRYADLSVMGIRVSEANCRFKRYGRVRLWSFVGVKRLWALE